MPAVNTGSRALDQTDITYVRPDTWSASPGIPGIDELHTFADPPRKLVDDPAPAALPGITPVGPSAVNQTKAPAIWSLAWWKRRNASRIALDEAGNGTDWVTTTQEPQPDTQRPRDPRTVAIPAPRWTAQSGPVLQAYLHRDSEHNLTGERRFVDPGGAAMAFTPSLRPSPASLGDGRGFMRFRTTERITPSGLDQQLQSQEQVNNSSSAVLNNGGTLSQRWW